MGDLGSYSGGCQSDGAKIAGPSAAAAADVGVGVDDPMLTLRESTSSRLWAFGSTEKTDGPRMGDGDCCAGMVLRTQMESGEYCRQEKYWGENDVKRLLGKRNASDQGSGSAVEYTYSARLAELKGWKYGRRALRLVAGYEADSYGLGEWREGSEPRGRAL